MGRAHLRGWDAALPVAAFDVEGGRKEIVGDAPELALVRDPLGAGVPERVNESSQCELRCQVSVCKCSFLSVNISLH